MEEKLYPRRWAILAALFLCLVTLQFSFIVPGGAALAVMMRYGIDGTLFSMIMSVPYFAGIVFGISWAPWPTASACRRSWSSATSSRSSALFGAPCRARASSCASWLRWSWALPQPPLTPTAPRSSARGSRANPPTSRSAYTSAALRSALPSRFRSALA